MSDQETQPLNVQALQVVLKALPYPHLVGAIDLSDEGVVRFDWRSVRYRVDYKDFIFHVSVIEGPVLIGCDKAILMQRLLRLVAIALETDGRVLPA